MEVSDVGSVSDWLEDEVCGWLTTWSLSEYSDVFRKNRIRGDVLLHLDRQRCLSLQPAPGPRLSPFHRGAVRAFMIIT